MKLLKKTNKKRKNVHFMHEKVHLLQVARQTCLLVKIKTGFHRKKDIRGRDGMVVRFTSTFEISAYHY